MTIVEYHILAVRMLASHAELAAAVEDGGDISATPPLWLLYWRRSARPPDLGLTLDMSSPGFPQLPAIRSEVPWS